MRLELKDVVVKRDRAAVLHGVSLEVPTSEVVALLGSNGAGKSTTLRTISGLHRLTSGKLIFEGEEIDRLSPQAIVKLGISHVPEGRRIFPELSVQDNLMLGAYVHGGVAKEDLDFVFHVFPDLKDILRRRGGALSGGQQQMLAIARAVVAKPKMLLLDEPSLGLSPLMVHAIGGAIEELRTAGLSILLVEQNSGLALRVADRGYVMVNGVIVAFGATSALLEDGDMKRAYFGI